MIPFIDRGIPVAVREMIRDNPAVQETAPEPIRADADLKRLIFRCDNFLRKGRHSVKSRSAGDVKHAAVRDGNRLPPAVFIDKLPLLRRRIRNDPFRQNRAVQQNGTHRRR